MMTLGHQANVCMPYAVFHFTQNRSRFVYHHSVNEDCKKSLLLKNVSYVNWLFHSTPTLDSYFKKKAWSHLLLGLSETKNTRGSQKNVLILKRKLKSFIRMSHEIILYMRVVNKASWNWQNCWGLKMCPSHQVLWWKLNFLSLKCQQTITGFCCLADESLRNSDKMI